MCNYAITLVESRTKEQKVFISLNCINDQLYVNYKNELIQVITIVLNNSFDAFISKNTENKHIIITVRLNEMCIEDNAGGIQAEILPLIFDPYFSTKNKKFGTGLGLYIATILMKNLINGSLSVKNIDTGCKFTLTLFLR